ncbi:hypothetical protein AB0N28_31595, partial [Streptomyces sp. NPDC051130]|uniref:hypothetical protein n=1 Tax=Streptomyces sp. NPDC051130 TaxID=3157223 RepID=UPI00341F0EFF
FNVHIIRAGDAVTANRKPLRNMSSESIKDAATSGNVKRIISRKLFINLFFNTCMGTLKRVGASLTASIAYSWPIEFKPLKRSCSNSI